MSCVTHRPQDCHVASLRKPANGSRTTREWRDARSFTPWFTETPVNIGITVIMPETGTPPVADSIVLCQLIFICWSAKNTLQYNMPRCIQISDHLLFNDYTTHIPIRVVGKAIPPKRKRLAICWRGPHDPIFSYHHIIPACETQTYT